MTMTRGPAGEVTRLRRLDLNLLVALDCLLVERGVSKAARRLGVSQSTASDALARLRRHFDDPLLQGKPRAYELSPLAQRLHPLVADAVRATDRVFAGASQFEPEVDSVEFLFYGSDHSLIFSVAKLSRAISSVSSEARVRMASLPTDGDYDELLREADGLLLPHGLAPSGANAIDLGVDDIVLVRDGGSPPVRSVHDLSDRPWVAVLLAAGAHDSFIRQILGASARPRVAVGVPTFSSVPYFIEGTDRVALLPRSLAESLQQGAAIAFQTPPVPVDPARMALWWHPSRTNDAVHSWLRDVVATTSGA
ncbi:LysR family transcriptional regulator [Microbacterium sp.]|uniref:LysR family transcriptional regulator n=1 Tax=Microbacterium sp. TaxID=51671 RepID=UPI0026175DD8|nr:LysR family transcriptional regulator [Microbacterium sp.]